MCQLIFTTEDCILIILMVVVLLLLFTTINCNNCNETPDFHVELLERLAVADPGNEGAIVFVEEETLEGTW